MNFDNFKNKHQKLEPVELSNSTSKEPLVSVCIQTYNHAEFIGECLDGILNQETNFTFEILLGEDDSDDGTRKICKEFAERHPDKIRLFLHHRENNIKVGGRPTGRFNFLYNMFSARGRYIALCEGDDYWTDPLKLQKQVDFLDKNEDFIIHSGNARYKTNSEIDGKPLYQNGNAIFDHRDFLTRNNLATCTVMFRNIPLKFPDCFLKVVFGDWFLYYLLAKSSDLKIYRSDEIYANYRVHNNGIMSKLDRYEFVKNKLHQVNCITKVTQDGKQVGEAKRFINRFSVKAFNELFKKKEYIKALRIFKNNIEISGVNTPFKRYAHDVQRLIRTSFL